jgi:hypothetical protein
MGQMNPLIFWQAEKVLCGLQPARRPIKEGVAAGLRCKAESSTLYSNGVSDAVVEEVKMNGPPA